MQNSADDRQKLLDSLMSRLGPKDRERVKALLADRAACERILNSPEAQDAIRKFKGGK